ncbi:hypothetical protein VTJ04DRAFT_10365 [Mycothermus thermophilus]|uniref:uncharacterized protein n=1 Tax=Humicola insolens TaxID=85995 RepID=UPI0037431FCD
MSEQIRQVFFTHTTARLRTPDAQRKETSQRQHHSTTTTGLKHANMPANLPLSFLNYHSGAGQIHFPRKPH